MTSPLKLVLNDLRDHYHDFLSRPRETRLSELETLAAQRQPEGVGILLDYTRQPIPEGAMAELFKVVDSSGLNQAIIDLFEGKKINNTEDRAALHVLLRAGKLPCDDLKSQFNLVELALKQMKDLWFALTSGQLRGFSGKVFTDVIHVGIGGSELGPRLATEALKNHPDALRVHFLSNLDGNTLQSLQDKLSPETTLIIVASKSFTTQETLVNAEAMCEWLQMAAGEQSISGHLFAVTACKSQAQNFGVLDQNILPIWDWVGGRYSLWSSIGLPILLHAGPEQFDQLLAGAEAMDKHFMETPREENLPVILALIGIWHRNVSELQSQAVVVYDDRLRTLVPHLQQLDMESNGKSVRADGVFTDVDTGPIIWGGVGANAQHAYFQHLHQGTSPSPVDLVGVVDAGHQHDRHHDLLLANLLGQAAALFRGRTCEEGGATNGNPHRHFEGSRPNNVILLKQLDAHTLGALLALFEHKVFVQAIIWGINPFDQWGVELGKSCSRAIMPVIESGVGHALDELSDLTLKKIRKWSKKSK
ncbi:MAG: glucose-6-phosphate isomerase [bacterium]